MFKVNQQLLDKAKRIFSQQNDIYWIIGGAASGKSTISQAIAAKTNITLYDMDAHIYSSYMGRYQDDRHPAVKAWLSAPNPLAWQLDLSLADFDAYNKAASAEYIDLLTDDIERMNHPVLIDGGITHPSLLAQIMPVENIVCMNTSDAHRINTWETAENRAEMRQWIQSLPQPDRMWQKFLACDKHITKTMVNDSQAHGIPVVEWDKNITAEALTNSVMKLLL